MYTSAQNDWSAEMFVVADGAGCEGGESGLGGGCSGDVGSCTCGGVSSGSSLRKSRTSDCSSIVSVALPLTAKCGGGALLQVTITSFKNGCDHVEHTCM